MMRSTTGFAAIALWCLVTGTSFGQGFPFQESRLNGAAILLRHEGVQAELKVTKEQNEKVREATEKVRAKFKEQFDKLEQTPTGRERSLAKRNLSQNVIAEVTKELPSILTPKQMTRLQQISFQQSGLQAFDESVVIEKLKLTKDQQEKITKIRDETKQEYLKLRQNRALTFEESKKKDHDLKKKTVDMAIAVLDAKQKELWKELHGETFDFVSANELKERAPERKLNEAERKLETLTDDTIDQKVAAWQPTPDERKIDLIGWADGIRHGIELGRKHNRPIIVHTYNDGRIREGRC